MTFSSDQPLLVNQLPQTIDLPEEPELLRQLLANHLRDISNSVNSKEGGLYSLLEQYCSNQYFILTNPQLFRNVYRKTFDMVDLNGGPIVAGATASFAHNITGVVAATRIFGTATNSDVPPKFIPLPYASATLVTDQVQVYMTSTNVVIINGSTQTDLTQCYVTLEYVKN